MCSLEVTNVLFRTFALPCIPVSYGLDTLLAVYISCMFKAFRMMHHLPSYCSASEIFSVNRVPNCAAVIGT